MRCYGLRDSIRCEVSTYIVCFLSILIVGFCLAPSVNASEKREVILATGEWPPYTSEQMNEYGIFTEIVSAVFTEMGVTPVYRFYPWKRTEMEVKKGNAFAAFPYTITQSRQKDFIFSESIAFNTGRLFYNTSKFPEGIVFKDINDLKKYRIGGSIGYWYEELFEKLGLDVEYAQTDEQNLHKLFLGRIDLFPMDENVGLYLINKDYPEYVGMFAFAEKPLNQDSLHLMISKTYPGTYELQEEFEKAYARIKEKGIYRDIINRYGVIVFRSETLLYLGGSRK